MSEQTTLADLGWTPLFQQQVSLEEMESLLPARVFEVQRTGLRLRSKAKGVAGRWKCRWAASGSSCSPEDRPTVGRLGAVQS